MSNNKRFKNSSQSTASAVEVEGLDDMLMLILVRLPPKSIFRSRCVSKRWKHVISTPFFLKAFSDSRKEPINKVVAYIQENYRGVVHSLENSYRYDSDSIRILPASANNDDVIAFDYQRLRGDLQFLNASNGLVLFQRGGCISNEYLVVNPIINRAVEVTRPTQPPLRGTVAAAIVCEDNTRNLIPTYKIVVAGKIGLSHYLTIHTYSSETREWTVSTPTMTGILDKDISDDMEDDVLERFSSRPLAVDGVIHWFTRGRSYLVVYHMDSDMVQLVDLPPECRANYCLKVARSSGDGDLWVCMHMPDSRYIKMWMVPGEVYASYRSQKTTIPSTAWIFMQSSSACTLPPPKEGDKTIRRCSYQQWCRGGALHKLPYVAFLMVRPTILRIWNYADKSYEQVKHRPGGVKKSRKGYRYDFSPYMEPFSLSSYAL